MEKKLPNVYANSINKKLNNVQEIFYGNKVNTERQVSINDIIRKINEIFNSPNHVYKSKVLITRNSVEEEKVIVGKTSNNLLTIDGEMIKISSIEDIKKRT